MRTCPNASRSCIGGARNSLLTLAMVSSLILGRFVTKALQTSSPAFLYSRPLAISAAKRFAAAKSTQLLSSLEEDTQGRRIRRRSSADNDTAGNPASPRSRGGGGWDDDDDWGAPGPKRKSSGGKIDRTNNDGGWDANYTPKPRSPGGRTDRSRDDDGWDTNYTPKPRSSGRRTDRINNDDSWDANYTPTPRSSGGRTDRSSNDDGWNANYTPRPRSTRQGGPPGRGSTWGQQNDNRSRDGRGRPSNFSSRGGRARQGDQFENSNPGVRAINMNALEGAGFVHLYGLSSVLNALQANRRDLTTSSERGAELVGDDEEDDEYSLTDREPPKPQAQFRPYLFVQERRSSSRRGQKATDAERVLALAEERNVPVAEVDKGILNSLSGNRPHQGFVLRCGKLDFEPLSRIPVPDDSEEETPSLWLVLDEVVDPQNLGALLRSAYFLGQSKLGVLVCSKNSAPPTPVVSAASAGALELVTVYSTTNLPRTLNQARDDGFRIIGASSSVPSNSGSSEFDDSEDAPAALYDLSDLPVSLEEDDRPVLLVLGSEGHGLRTLVAKACTEFVRIPSAGEASSEDEEGGEGVDSLNVSVTGGILLWQLLSGRK